MLNGGMTPWDYYTQSYDRSQQGSEIQMRMEQLRNEQIRNQFLMDQEAQMNPLKMDDLRSQIAFRTGGGAAGLEARNEGALIGDTNSNPSNPANAYPSSPSTPVANGAPSMGVAPMPAYDPQQSAANQARLANSMAMMGIPGALNPSVAPSLSSAMAGAGYAPQPPQATAGDAGLAPLPQGGASAGTPADPSLPLYNQSTAPAAPARDQGFPAANVPGAGVFPWDPNQPVRVIPGKGVLHFETPEAWTLKGFNGASVSGTNLPKVPTGYNTPQEAEQWANQNGGIYTELTQNPYGKFTGKFTPSATGLLPDQEKKLDTTVSKFLENDLVKDASAFSQSYTTGMNAAKQQTGAGDQILAESVQKALSKGDEASSRLIKNLQSTPGMWQKLTMWLGTAANGQTLPPESRKYLVDVLNQAKQSRKAAINDQIAAFKNPLQNSYRIPKQILDNSFTNPYDDSGAASSAASQTSSVQPSSIPRPSTPEEAAKLPSGTVFLTPDGRTKVAP